ncbi:hypothetical protein [Methanobrevibacter sp.]|nr:hypothetical protein [Methanobrevibacter sp.]MDO5823621.1 hypothetical protein [Methanobrevibacter sp.]
MTKQNSTSDENSEYSIEIPATSMASGMLNSSTIQAVFESLGLCL